MRQALRRVCAALARAALFLALMGGTLWRENVMSGAEPPTQEDGAVRPRGPQSLR